MARKDEWPAGKSLQVTEWRGEGAGKEEPTLNLHEGTCALSPLSPFYLQYPSKAVMTPWLQITEIAGFLHEYCIHR